MMSFFKKLFKKSSPAPGRKIKEKPANLACKIGAADFTLLQEQSEQTDFTCQILYNWDKVEISRFQESTDFAKWEQGFVFGKEAQIRWRRRNGGFHLVLISDTTIAEGWDEARTIQPEPVTGPLPGLLLWGEKLTGPEYAGQLAWFDARIPHILEYPIANPDPAKKRVAIGLKRYSLQESTQALQQGRDDLGLCKLPLAEPYTTSLERFTEVFEL